MSPRLTSVALLSLFFAFTACSSGSGGSDPEPGPDVVDDAGGEAPVDAIDVAGEPDLGGEADVPATVDVACVPECGGLECGFDPVCGESCGSCEDGESCVEGLCTCVPDCAGRNCGDDGCGGSCGECSDTCSCVQGVCANCSDCVVGSACLDWFDCVMACEGGEASEDCETNCDAMLRPEALTAKDALVDCRYLHCGACGDDEACLADCDAGMCRDASVDCLVTYGCGIDACLGFEDCIDGCQELDEGIAACETGCHRVSSAQGLRDAYTLRDCLAEACPDNLGDEAQAKCLSEVVLDPDGCRGEADPCLDIAPFCDPTASSCLDCVQLLDCLGLCPDDDDDCLYGCVAGASEESYEQVRDLYACLEGVCDPSLSPENWDACAADEMAEGGACESEATPCVEDDDPFCDPETETCLDCAGLVSCLEACEEDEACQNTCLSDASVDAIGLMQGFFGCVAAYCDGSTLSQAEWDACVDDAGSDVDKCAVQHGACFGDA